jgi:hypothetical protein
MARAEKQSRPDSGAGGVEGLLATTAGNDDGRHASLAPASPAPHHGAMRILDVEQAATAEAAGLTDHLIEGEAVGAAFVSPTGAILFTDRRILLVAREHLLEERVETSSYPYREVRRFGLIEGAQGFLQLRIWIGDEDHPLHLRGRPGADLRAIQRLLADKLV